MRAAGLADAMRCGAEAMMHMGAAHHRSCALPHSMLSWCRRARWSAQARALDGRGRRIRLISISRRVRMRHGCRSRALPSWCAASAACTGGLRPRSSGARSTHGCPCRGCGLRSVGGGAAVPTCARRAP
jgi:hypothetical protein